MIFKHVIQFTLAYDLLAIILTKSRKIGSSKIRNLQNCSFSTTGDSIFVNSTIGNLINGSIINNFIKFIFLISVSFSCFSFNIYTIVKVIFFMLFIKKNNK